MSALKYFRKKPVTISAVQWDGTYRHAKQLELELGLYTQALTSHEENDTCTQWRIATLEDGHVVSPMDWIITGVKGEHYPCKPDVFELTYEAALAQPADVVYQYQTRAGGWANFIDDQHHRDTVANRNWTIRALSVIKETPHG